jgi:twitching motility protein PilT
MQARADLASLDKSSESPTPSAKPQVKLVKVDGKLTVVPVQTAQTEKAVAPGLSSRPAQSSEPLRIIDPEPAPRPSSFTERRPVTEVSKSKSGLLDYASDTSLKDLLQQAMERGASDLHVHSGAVLRIRVAGNFVDATADILDSQVCKGLITGILSETQIKRLHDKLQIDFAYEIPGVGRFRANVYKQQRGLDAVFRTIKPAPPTLAELGLPREFEKFTEFHQGLMLFTGPAGCGKSSTMAAMVDLINTRRPDHILTIEDPIEYVHASKSCNVTQREVGAQTVSFPTALRAALREDPDVIVIGELRDLETISLAITAAETGHLVMATLHTSNAIRTINRLLSVFPPDQMCQVSRMLSESLKVVISQRLVQRADNSGQVAALEVMVNNNAVANLIRENRTHQIKSILQTGRAKGQRLLDASLSQLMKERVITSKEALRHAEEPEGLK